MVVKLGLGSGLALNDTYLKF